MTKSVPASSQLVRIVPGVLVYNRWKPDELRTVVRIEWNFVDILTPSGLVDRVPMFSFKIGYEVIL